MTQLGLAHLIPLDEPASDNSSQSPIPFLPLDSALSQPRRDWSSVSELPRTAEPHEGSKIVAQSNVGGEDVGEDDDNIAALLESSDDEYPAPNATTPTSPRGLGKRKPSFETEAPHESKRPRHSVDEDLDDLEDIDDYF